MMKELMRTTPKSAGDSPTLFDCLPTQIEDMSYNALRRLEIGKPNQTSDEFHACLAARDYMRDKPAKFEKDRQTERERKGFR